MAVIGPRAGLGLGALTLVFVGLGGLVAMRSVRPRTASEIVPLHGGVVSRS